MSHDLDDLKNDIDDNTDRLDRLAWAAGHPLALSLIAVLDNAARDGARILIKYHRVGEREELEAIIEQPPQEKPLTEPIG